MDKYQYKVKGVDYDVVIEEIKEGMAKVTVNGKPFEVELKQPIKVHQAPKLVHVEAPKPVVSSTQAETPQPVPEVGAGTKVLAPLPGTITELKVKVGDSVKAGDTILVLEAMKMQNNIEADATGTITSILVKQGETVMEGAALVTIG